MSTFAQNGRDFDKSFAIVRDNKQCTAWKIEGLIRFVRGEWFADRRLGVPYFQYIIGQKAPNMRIVKNIFRQVILSAPGVQSLDALDVTMDRSTRALAVSFAVTTSTGDAVYTDEPFIITAGKTAS